MLNSCNIICHRGPCGVKTLILNISYSDDINDWQRINISTIQELCKMRDGILYSGLNTQEIQVLIDFICTEDIMPIP